MTLSRGRLPFFLPTSAFTSFPFHLLSIVHPFSSFFLPCFIIFSHFNFQLGLLLSHHPSFLSTIDTPVQLFSFIYHFVPSFFNRFCIVCLRLSDYKILRSARRKVQFVVKFKTEHLVDLEFILPSRTLTMDDVRVETDGFIPRGNPLVNLMQMSSRKYAFWHVVYTCFFNVLCLYMKDIYETTQGNIVNKLLLLNSLWKRWS